MQWFLKSKCIIVEISMVKIGELLRKLRSLRSCFHILPPGALTPQGIEGAMKRDVSKHWCTLQWCASRGWYIAHENWTSCYSKYPGTNQFCPMSWWHYSWGIKIVLTVDRIPSAVHFESSLSQGIFSRWFKNCKCYTYVQRWWSHVFQQLSRCFFVHVSCLRSLRKLCITGLLAPRNQ